MPRRARIAVLACLAVSGALPARASALLELRFVTPPALPTLPAVKLTGATQTVSTKMTEFSLENLTLSGSGWNITAQGQSAAGKSPVFAQYCPAAKCGSSPEGYVAGGATMPAESLVLNTTGATFSGGLVVQPTWECAAGCALDGPTPVKIASQKAGLLVSEGDWTASFAANSLRLTVPAALRAPPSGEQYRVNILWTISSGP